MASQMNQMFGQLQDRLNAPHPLATAIPGMSDPVEIAKFGRPAEQPAQSAFEGLADVTPRRRGRPPGSTNAPKEQPEGPAAA
jgi:hypothetical protein